MAVFAAAALLALLVVMAQLGDGRLGAWLLMPGAPGIVTAALLARLAHRRLMGSSRLAAMLTGGAIALASALAGAAAVGVIMQPTRPAQALGIAAYVAVVALLRFGLPTLLIGAGAGWLLQAAAMKRR